MTGTVEDQNGAVIVGASVTVLNINTRLQREATTNEQGYFIVALLPPSTYTVTVRRDGFAPTEFPNVVLNVGDQKSLQIQLKAGIVSEMVKIEGDAPLINESPAIGTVVDREFVANIPLNGRTFQSLISLSPGFVFRTTGVNSIDPGQFSVNGQRADANYFTVDGVSANFGTTSGVHGNNTGTAGAQPALAATGGTQSLVSIDALQEFKVQTSSYAPEFGRSPGAQVQITTRSGTNDFHGVIFDYLRNDVFDANDWFANANRQLKPQERQNDFGGTFSGPVLLPRFGEGDTQPWYEGRNKTFFFFSYEGLRLVQPQAAVTQVPTLTVRQQASSFIQPYLNAFPIPNGPDLLNAQGQATGYAQFAASYSDSITLDATSVRIDQNLGSRLTLFGRFNYSPSVQVTRQVGINNLANYNSTPSNTKTFTLGSTYLITPRAANDLRFNYSTSEVGTVGTLDSFGGAIGPTDELLFPILKPEEGAVANISFTYNGGNSQYLVGANAKGSQRQLNLVDSLSITVGDHQLKMGADFRQLWGVFLANGLRYTASIRDLASVRNGTVTSLSVQGNQTVRPRFINLSFYTQDTWKVSPRVTLTYGLRWELNPPPSERDGNEALTLTNLDNPMTFAVAPRGTPLYRTSYTNFAPRVGVAYQLLRRQARELLLRGGVGRFHAMGNEAASRAYFGYPFGVTKTITNAPLPLTTAQLTPPAFPTSFTPPFPGQFNVLVPDLKLPETWQWNVALEQSLGARQAVSASYVGAAARRLLRRSLFFNFNPNFPSGVNIFSNGATSDYHALQLQYDRRLSRGLQALFSYTWGHAIDEVSSILNQLLERGSADFDVRHAVSGAVTYNIPRPRVSSALDAILRDWSVDGIVHYQSATPVDLSAGSITLTDGVFQTLRPDLMADVPLYIDDPKAPGGRRFNPAAFRLPPRNASGQFLRQGTLGRNVLRGFPLSQVDIALRRQFNLTEKLSLQLRAEAFNIFNHPNFGAPNNSLTSGLFGRSTQMFGRSIGGLSPIYQVGGPRTFQFALKMGF